MGSLAERLIQEDVARVLTASDCLQQLRDKHLFITGGTGFVGTWLLEILAGLNNTLEKPCHVYVLTRQPDVFRVTVPHLAKRSDFTFLEGDVCSFIYPDIPCDFVLHAATPSDRHVVNNEPVRLLETIVSGTQHVLNFASEKHVNRFLFVSSGAVYGTQPPTCSHMSEAYNGSPALNAAASTYAEAKRLAEVICAIYREKYHLALCIARPFTFVGPYQRLDAGFAVTDFIRDGLAKKSLSINSDGTAVRSYAYGADVARELLTILLRGRSGSAYNVGSDYSINITGLAQKILVHLREFGIQTEIKHIQPMGGYSTSNRYVPDVTLIREELGLSLLFSLDEALSKTIAWFAHKDSEIESS